MAPYASLSDTKRAIQRKKHEEAKASFLKHLVGGDETVKIALIKVATDSTPSGTLRSRPNSLLKLIRNEMDDPVALWLTRNDVDVDWKFSSLIQQGYGEIRDAFQRLRHGLQSEDFLSTIDNLIDFLFFCSWHESESENVILLKPPKGEKENEGENFFRPSNFRKLGSRAISPSEHFHTYLHSTRDELLKAGLCIACGNPNATAEQKNRIMKENLGADEKKIKRAISEGTRVRKEPEGARLYCHRHAENSVGNAGAKKARRTALAFMSLLFLMRRKEVRSSLNTQFPPEFDFEFARNVIIQSDPNDFADILKTEGHGILRRKKDLLEKNAECVSGVRAIRKQLPLMLHGTAEEKALAIRKLQLHITEMMLSFHGVLPSVYKPGVRLCSPNDFPSGETEVGNRTA